MPYSRPGNETLQVSSTPQPPYPGHTPEAWSWAFCSRPSLGMLPSSAQCGLESCLLNDSVCPYIRPRDSCMLSSYARCSSSSPSSFVAALEARPLLRCRSSSRLCVLTYASTISSSLLSCVVFFLTTRLLLVLTLGNTSKRARIVRRILQSILCSRRWGPRRE